MRNTSRNFKPFVANRISEIHDTTDPEKWRHVPGEVNPADIPTGGSLVSELIKSKLWLEGPDFLQAQESSWPEKLPKPRMPENAEVLEKNLEQRTHLTDQAEKANVQTEETTDHADRLDPTRFSSYSRLLHVTGWVCRFTTNYRSAKDSRESSDLLTRDELINAEQVWLRRAQVEAFPQGVKEKTLRQTDDNGILRVNGRLKYAEDLPFDARHPILLPRSHPVTTLIINSERPILGP